VIYKSNFYSGGYIMDIRVDTAKLNNVQTEAAVVAIFEDTQQLSEELEMIDQVLGNTITRLIEHEQLKGKYGEINPIDTLGKLPYEYLVLVGMGKEKDFNTDKLRGIVSEACRYLRNKQIQNIAFFVPSTDLTLKLTGQIITEGAVLGLYTFRKHITAKPEQKGIQHFTIIAPDKNAAEQIKSGLNTGRIIAEAVNLTRDMVNEPSNFMTPENMADVAKKIAQDNNLEIDIFEREAIQQLGMGALLGVSQGSNNPPKFIVLKYKGRSDNKLDLALIGKGLTFDSGGISLKPSEKMEEMKGDMAGGAAVLGAISAIAQLKPAINVAAVIAAVENMPGGKAYKPGDVVQAMNGKTIEVISTDAEGRLTLADALSYVNIKLKAKHIVDVATLTGACITALGNICSGLFSNNQPLADQVKAASAASGELTWQMPMFEEYKEQNKSDVADMKNTGGRPAGAITAALLLSEFAAATPWVHLDIAGVDQTDRERKYYVKGATGIPVRTLVNLAINMSDEK
jgi:leucyl aminopeptidase